LVTTIDLLQKEEIFGVLNFLEYKHRLLQLKNSGWIFFRDSLAELTKNTPIRIYFAILPTVNTAKDAFPVPIEFFSLTRNISDQLNFMKNYYERYYEVEISDLEFFSGYDCYRPYVAREFVWYFRRGEECAKFSEYIFEEKQ